MYSPHIGFKAPYKFALIYFITLPIHLIAFVFSISISLEF